ncbi:MAG TPA: flagellar biosynthetic protein FliO [Candidatus Hydrogenedentes bacterium]|nr:flagellar biosynthetic protein FliO [Candidatus Hydrogenedentota bacterium]HPG67907.1 flagellar biosynthetic protein FliO [Candidatus Hydrogenedentota bacterium]
MWTRLVLVLAVVAGAVAAGETAAEADAEGFERTAEPQWRYESAVDIEPEAPPQAPEDPKLAEVNAELDRLEGASKSETRSRQAFRESVGWQSVLRAVSGLCLVVAAILLGSYLLRRYGRRTPLLAGAELGRVLGKIYLSPKVSLHFVQTGGQVLVVGVSQSGISLISEFDAAAFGALLETPESHGRSGEGNAAPSTSGEADSARKAFLAELEASARELRDSKTPAADEDIDSLRQDIVRLQKYLKDNLRED